LWAYQTTWRNTTGYSPYQLVFGKEPIFPIEFEIETLRTVQEVALNLNEAQINILQQINDLDEIRLSALQHTALIQQHVIAQVVPWLLKGYSRGNHKPIFGLQVLAHLQSERALSLGFSFV